MANGVQSRGLGQREVAQVVDRQRYPPRQKQNKVTVKYLPEDFETRDLLLYKWSVYKKFGDMLEAKMGPRRKLEVGG